MSFYRILMVCGLVFGSANCRKKSEAVESEIREAGYAMTPEGWFGAVGDNDVAVMRKMGEGGFDVETKDPAGDTGLHVAAVSGAKEAAEFLLNKGFAIDGKGAKGRTPLMAAVTADQTEMVQWLLRQGADPKLKDEDGFVALMLAVTSGSEGAVAEIAPYHREDLDSALLLASLVGEAGVIDTLTNYGASVYARMEDGRTPLMLAAQNGHKEAAAMLIDIGASRFATTEGGETAQGMAVSAGHAELAEMIGKGFSGDVLALESDEEVAEAMGGHLDEFQAEADSEPEGMLLAENEGGPSSALTSGADIPGEEDQAGQEASQDAAVSEVGIVAGPLTSREDSNGVGGSVAPRVGAAVGGIAGRNESVKPLGGSTVSKSATAAETERPDGISESGGTRSQAAFSVQDLPLVMRQFRQRELPVEVRKVSGGVASLRLAGAQPKEVQVRQGETIPGSDLVVVRVFSRTEHGKLNNGGAVEIGVVEVEDTGSGLKREWLEGRPASGHDPVALVEDAETGRRYLAKPGQRFRSEDGREFIVNDVRPSQLVIEDAESGEVRTLRLRGPRG